MIHSITAPVIMHIWENGLKEHPLERAVTMLAAALPEATRNDLLNLSVGQRDTYLMLLREYTFGNSFTGFAECPHCQEQVEFTFDAELIRVGAAPVEQIRREQQYAVADYEIQAHLPTHEDMLALRTCRSVSEARALLLQRCIVSAVHDGNELALTELPETIIATLGERMIEQDPQMDVHLHLSCPACEHHWAVMFDIGIFVWVEICTYATRLLREVDTLAKVYGWHEADILAMSAIRRQAYLEMVS